MEIRTATFSDLEAMERLRMPAFATTPDSVLHGTPLEKQLEIRVKLWQAAGELLHNVLLAMDGAQLVGSIMIFTRETRPRLAWADLAILRPLGWRHTVRYLVTWLLVNYKPAPDEAYLYGLVVDPAYRRHGVGVQLTTAAEEQARRLGKKMASAYVHHQNTPSLQLTQKLGYRMVEGQHSGWRRLVGRQSPYLRMEKPLGEKI